MILSYREDSFTVPHTSTCVVHNTGVIRNNDIVSVTSPVFASTNFVAKSINMSDRFSVPIRITNEVGYITIDAEITATLVCDDSDIFNMYVKL